MDANKSNIKVYIAPSDFEATVSAHTTYYLYKWFSETIYHFASGQKLGM